MGNPPFRVSDLAFSADSTSSRPHFTVKYPAHKAGTPKPPPIFSKKPSISTARHPLGGKPCPDPRWPRKSLATFSPKAGPPGVPFDCSFAARPPSLAQVPKSLCVPQARAPYMVTAASLAQSRRQKSLDQFSDIVQRVGTHCELHDTLAASKHPAAHVQQLLASFAVNTLYRYLACCLTFIDCMHAQRLSFASNYGIDFLRASAASKQQDRAVHRSSSNTAIKALRWVAKRIQWHALSACVRNALVTAYSKQIDSYDKKEAVPLPLALIVMWELLLCTPGAPLTTKLVLGAAPVCTRASIRSGDAQRVKWGSLQLSTQGLRAVAYAAKTTKRGQSFACAWHGISGRDSSSSWLLRWLASLAQLPRTLFQAEGCTHEPDFLFPHVDMQCLSVSFLAPASYARTLLCLRWAAQDKGLSQHARLSTTEASALTLHSVKSTALALAAHSCICRKRTDSLRAIIATAESCIVATTPSQVSLCSATSVLRWPKAGDHNAPWPAGVRRLFQNRLFRYPHKFRLLLCQHLHSCKAPGTSLPLDMKHCMQTPHRHHRQTRSRRAQRRGL